MPEHQPFWRRHISSITFGVLGVFIAVLFHYLPILINPKHSIHQAHFKILWSHETKRQILTAPLIANGMLVFGTYDGTLEAISIADERIAWSLKFPDAIFSLTKDKANTIYMGTGLHTNQRGLFSTIDATTGKIIWQREFTGHLEEPPTIDEQNHRLWVGAGPGSLWALNTRNGDVLWHRDIGHLDATPLLHNDALYVPAQKDEMRHESFFYALNPSDGRILWQVDQPGQPWAAPLIDKTGEIILTTTGDGQIGLSRPSDKGWAQAVSSTGETLWQRNLPDMVMTPGVYIPERNIVIYVMKNGIISAINTSDGSIAWEKRTAHGFSAPPTQIIQFKENLVAVTSDDGTFYMIDAETGDIVFSKKMPQKGSIAVISDNNIIYITTSFAITAIGEI